MTNPVKALFRRIAKRLYDAGRRDMRDVSPCLHLVSGWEQASIDPSCRLLVEQPQAHRFRIFLGEGAWLGRNVALSALGDGNILIGEDTSLQDDCLVGGDVRIGAHCLFGKNVFLSSTAHRFRDRPPWLIRDQDRLSWTDPAALLSSRSRRILIEDDCWIGQGVVVSPGVTIGRGAVVGANSVVTGDIAPYEVHGGVPARRIGIRLAFQPPASLDPARDDHIPYLYRGFHLTRNALTESRAAGGVRAGTKACMVLAGYESAAVTMRGKCDGQAVMDISVNGAPSVRFEVENLFDLRIGPASRRTDGGQLSPHTVIEIITSRDFLLAGVTAEPAA